MKIQGVVILIGCGVTAVFPVSKFHLVWWFVVAYFIPMVLMGRRGISIEGKIAQLQKESEQTGVSVFDLIQRETEKMEKEQRN